jgi:hypothetical protein
MPGTICIREALLKAVTNRRKSHMLQAALCLECGEFIDIRERPVFRQNDAGRLQDHHADIVDEKRGYFVKWMSRPGNGFHTVGAGKWIIIGYAASSWEA